MSKLLIPVLLLAQTFAGGTFSGTTLVRTAGGTSNESVPVTITSGVSVPAGGSLWRCTSFAEADGNDCARDVDDNATYTAESWQSYDTNLVCNDENVHPTTEEVKIDFDTPTATPTATTNAQKIRIAITKTNATCNGYQSADAHPTFDLYVWDGNSLETLATNVSCGTWNQNEPTPYSFTYEGGSDGSEVYVEFFDDGNGETGTNRKRCGIEYIEWYAETN